MVPSAQVHVGRSGLMAAVAVLGAGLFLAAPAIAQGGPGTEAQLAQGKTVYDTWCSQCHGETGDGRGIATPFLEPWPRDFTGCKYQVRSTPTGALPTDADIRRVIEQGIPGTAMPAFSVFGQAELDGLVYYLESFCDDFADPEAYDDPIPIPADPGFDPAHTDLAKGLYEETGCARCHGDLGRGDGKSAPTLIDDLGQRVRAADLTRPWTFNGGATRADIFRSISTGLNGTPMAGFESALTAEQRWRLVDFITSISGGAEVAPYANVLDARVVDGELDLARGEELFADAPTALFPLIGQVMEPGRDFHPAVIAVEARAVYNADEVAFMLSWHDLQADTGATNAPDLVVPREDEGDPRPDRAGAAPTTGSDDPFADETVDDPFADEEAVDPFADDATADPFAESAEDEAPAGIGAADYSDAVAIQFPRSLPEGVRRPYFVFGDAQYPVELWYRNLAASVAGAQVWQGRGSGALAVVDEVAPETTATFADGRWVVMFKRSRQAGQGISFPPDSFVPIAFSVWDGFSEERGSKRALTTWYDVYVPPAERLSPVGPMVKAAAAIFVAELLLIGFVRFRTRRIEAGAHTSP